MRSSEVRKRFIEFFKSSPRNHKEIPPAPLVLEDDPTTLFTSSGMQPLVPYLMGEEHPKGNRLVDSQPSIRTVDIDEVGDNRHLTFFEMLGNWSLGDYFKEDQLNWFYKFLTRELRLEKDKLWVTVFEGNKQVPKDEESVEIWKKIGISEDRIGYYGADKNWWSRSGTPEKMPVGEIGGPDSEVFYDFGKELGHHERSEFKNKKCHINCDCGRFMEIGNSVFIQYKKVGEDKLEELPQKNVDFGGGLERIAAVVNGNPDIYKTDLFSGLIDEIEKRTGKKYEENREEMRVVADHLKAAVFISANAIYPSNKGHGYVLRRLIRRSVVKLHELGNAETVAGTIKSITENVAEIYFDSFLKEIEVQDVSVSIESEVWKFIKVLDEGVKRIEKLLGKGRKVDASLAFDLFQTYGFPLEATEEYVKLYGQKFKKGDKEEFEKLFEEHQERSRSESSGVFKGGLADHSSETVKLHTATHLLLASLRKVLGDYVIQKGQNITKERARFDFPNSQKLSDKQIKKVENMINEVIEKDLPVNFKVMPKEKALKTGAIHAFNEKYADTVKVYYVGDDLKTAFSKEFCGGPHVKSTGSIGRVKIKKQEKIGAGLVRIYAVLK